MSKFLLTFFLLTVAGLQMAIAQTQSAWIKSADKAYEKEDYYSAYRYYSIALEYDSNRTDLWYKFAQSARQFNADSTAEKAYQKVLESPTVRDFPEAAFWLGTVKQRRGKYQAAINLYEQYIEDFPDHSETLSEKARRNIEDAEWALEVTDEPADLKIRHLGDKINSPYSDFAATLVEDTLYYSSFKYLFRKDTVNPPRNFIKILRSVDGEAGRPISDAFGFANLHVAHSTFNLERSKMYYTVCEYESVTDIRCDLYVSKRGPRGKWGEGRMLDINEKGATSTEPQLAVDLGSGEQVLYFASNREGGQGGLDIWRSTLMDDGSLSEPENLSGINTAGDEMTPFYDPPTQTLYFSSDGYRTLGGLDIYKSRREGYAWASPVHLGAPINSSYNDLYYSVYEGGAKVYFSSNRPDSAAIFWDDSRDACCNDIYYIDVDISVELDLLTFDARTKYPLAGTTVKLYELLPDGKKLIDSLVNPSANDYHFNLQHGKKYWVEASKKDYLPESTLIDLSDPSTKKIRKIQKELYLPRETEINLQASTYNKLDGSPIVGATVKLYELTSYGPVLVDSLHNPLDNQFTFPLDAGKKYMLKGEYPGFYPAIDTFDLSSPELAGRQLIERRLELEPSTELLVRTYQELDKLPLNGAVVKLYELSNGEEKLVAEIEQPDDYHFEFPLKPGKKYVIKGFRDGYFPETDTVDLSSPELYASRKIERDLFFNQALEARTFDAGTMQPLAGTTVELYELTPEGPVLVDTITNFTGNDFLFPIDMNKKYLISANKDGYQGVRDTLRFTPEDMEREGGKLKVDLLLKRISFDDFLPIALYFDNDRPDPRTYKRTTDKEYIQTNEEYYAKKDEFIKEFTKDLSEEEAFLTSRRYHDFFDREVDGGRKDLQTFTEQLLQYLKGGNSITIRLKGFASPRASEEYNKILSARRIDAVKNHFRRYEYGVFQQYLKSGQLAIEEENLGESTADLSRISDRIDDPKNSIFSVIASVERRVEIVEINTGDDVTSSGEGNKGQKD